MTGWKTLWEKEKMLDSNIFFLSIINPLPHNGRFYWERSISNTLREMEKLVVTNIFSISHNVFYPIKEELHHLSHIFAKHQFAQGYNFVFWLTLYQMTKFHTRPN